MDKLDIPVKLQSVPSCLGRGVLRACAFPIKEVPALVCVHLTCVSKTVIFIYSFIALSFFQQQQ